MLNDWFLPWVWFFEVGPGFAVGMLDKPLIPFKSPTYQPYSSLHIRHEGESRSCFQGKVIAKVPF